MLNVSRNRNAVVLIVLALVAVLTSSGAEQATAAPVDVRLSEISFRADQYASLGSNQLRLSGNVLIGNKASTLFPLYLGVNSEVIINTSSESITSFSVDQEAGILAESGLYPIVDLLSLTMNVSNGKVIGESTILMPGASANFMRLEGKFELDVNTPKVLLEMQIYDENLLGPASEWPLMAMSLDMGASFDTVCLNTVVGISEPVHLADQITIEAGGELSFCPATGKYTFDLGLSGIQLQLGDAVTGITIGWSPVPLEELFVEVDTRAQQFTLRGTAEISKIVGLEKSLIGLTVEAGTVFDWGIWEWSGSAAVDIDALKGRLIHIRATSMSFNFDFANLRFEFTSGSEWRIGELFGLRSLAHESFFSLRPLAISGTGTIYDFEGSINLLGGTSADTDYLVNIDTGTVSGSFQDDFGLFDFHIGATNRSWQWLPDECLVCVGFSHNIELVSAIYSEITSIVAAGTIYGTVNSTIEGPFNLTINQGASYTMDRIGFVTNVTLFNWPVSIVVYPDKTWDFSFGLKGTAAGLQYLSDRHRNYSNGSWSNNIGITSLNAIAFMNAGFAESHPDVKQAIEYILSNVRSDGSIYADYYHRNYETSVSLLALKATHNPEYLDEIDAAKDWLLLGQWDEDCLWGSVEQDHPYWGGFGYGRNTRSDLSNTQFALLALDAAEVPKDDPMWEKALKFVSRSQNRQASNEGYSPHDDGGFIYYPGSTLSPDATSYGSITGAGIWGLALAGVTPADDRFADALDWVEDNYTWDFNPLTNSSWDDNSLYYYYMSMSKGLSMARKTTVGADHDWYLELAKKLVSMQSKDGSWANSNTWLWENNPELATSYALLALQTRLLPPEADLEMVFILHSPADLHLFDPQGRHVGKNYETDSVDLEIPGASYSPEDPQTIRVNPPVAGSFHLELVGTADGQWELELIGYQNGVAVSYESFTGAIEANEVLATDLNVGAFEGGLTIYASDLEATAVMNVEPKMISVSGLSGETVVGNLLVGEVGGSVAIEDTNIILTDLQNESGEKIAASTISVEPSAFAVAAGEEQNITVSIPIPEETKYDIYRGFLVVESLNAGAKNVPIELAVSSLGEIVVRKVTLAEDSTEFSFTGDLGYFELSAGMQQVFKDQPEGSYAIFEEPKKGWVLDSVECHGGDSESLDRGIVVNLEAGQSVECTFTNSRRQVSAEAGGPYSGEEGRPLALDASKTTNRDMVKFYKWDCTADGTIDMTTTSPTGGRCKYEEDGEYDVRLWVIDIFGNSKTDTAEVVIENVAPEVNVGADQTVIAGTEVPFVGTFFDPGTADTHTILWDFGDGQQVADTLTPTHVFADEGSYTVKLTVTDDDGGVGTDELQVDVINSAPTISDLSVMPVEIDEGGTVTLSGTMADSSAETALTLMVEWGDGQSETVEFDPGSTEFSLDHLYVDDNPTGTPSDTYIINLKLTDEQGDFSTSVASATVNNVAPTVDAGPANLEVMLDQTVTFSAVIDDPGIEDTHTITWDFGDDSAAAGGLQAAHSFAEPGEYTVTVTVSDDDGGVAQQTITVTVSELQGLYLPAVMSP